MPGLETVQHRDYDGRPTGRLTPREFTCTVRFGAAVLRSRMTVLTDPTCTEAMSDLPALHYPGEPDPDSTAESEIQEARLWRSGEWTARVIKNDDDEGWAVAMIKRGESEPALVGPWTMGRDKKNPKPLDTAAFNTLVKTASEVLRRHEQQLHAQLHKRMAVTTAQADIDVTLDIVPDEDDPYALLSAFDAAGARLAQVRVPADFRLTRASAAEWIDNAYCKPR